MEKNKIIAKKINLKNQVEREIYSKKLQNFEKEFTYPLGNESFYINHGLEKDYFVFFEKLGKPNIMVLENNNEIIGLCCAILRNINGKNIWYICDFKIKKEFRGKKLYKKLINELPEQDWLWYIQNNEFEVKEVLDGKISIKGLHCLGFRTFSHFNIC